MYWQPQFSTFVIGRYGAVVNDVQFLNIAEYPQYPTYVAGSNGGFVNDVQPSNMLAQLEYPIEVVGMVYGGVVRDVQFRNMPS